jgi:glycosyltransferase involved in cell wall biosynthesis
VLDFRDAWVANPSMKPDGKWLAFGNACLERLCIRSANVVVCTTDGIRADFESRYRDQTDKFITITNGFDPSDFPPDLMRAELPRRALFRIVHAGTLNRVRSPKDFLRALGQLVQERPPLLNLLEVIFVGHTSSFSDGRTIQDYAEDFGCGSIVKTTGYVSRKESLDFIQQADLLLMIIGRVPKEEAYVYGISGKLYDYAAARKPVLTISEPGATADLAQRLDLGPVAHPEDVTQIKAAIVGLYEAHESGGIPYRTNQRLLSSYEFSNLTARLVKCFEALSTDPRSVTARLSG